ncbi:hypothetical protein QE152_g40080 [Popillia japonica]|uniref:Endonuclease/exonuclease/phosphatase domain-containing protein n=1 Tax=Popillia japonica TaxID=7064 RepID=A0AAW1HSY7_POPJA
MQNPSIFYANIQCLRNKLDGLEAVLCEHNIDVLCLCEHWLSLDEAQSLGLRNYNLAVKFCRIQSENGGVCILVKNIINYKEIDRLDNFSSELELEVCGIHLYELNLIIVTIYRSPTGNFDTLLIKLEDLLSSISKFNTNIILLGDFNVDFLIENRDCLRLTDLLNSFNLHKKIDEPTRITQHSATYIDNCFSDINNTLLTTKVAEMLSDRHSLKINLMYKKTYNNYSLKRPLSETGLMNFTLDIINFNWSIVEELFRKYRKEYSLYLSKAKANSNTNFIRNSENKSKAA